MLSFSRMRFSSYTFIQLFESAPETAHISAASFLFSLPHSLCPRHTGAYLTFSLLVYKLFLPQGLCTCWISSTSLPPTHYLGFNSKSLLSERQLLTNPVKATAIPHIPMPSKDPLSQQFLTKGVISSKETLITSTDICRYHYVGGVRGAAHKYSLANRGQVCW